MPFVFASLLGLVLAGLAGIDPVSAQQPVHHALSGRPKLLSVYFNCTNRYGLMAMSPTGSAQNGIVRTRLSAGNRCGNPRQPLMQVWYISRPGFRGRDEVYIQTFGAPRRLTVFVR